MKEIQVTGDLKIKWLGHASFLITFNNKIIYIDPYKLKEEIKADYIFITHSHHDHFSPEDISKIVKENTKIYATSDCSLSLNSVIEHIKPGFSKDVGGFTVKAIPAYNPNKSFHPKSKNWVGYIFNFNNKKIYHTGDCDLIPEMQNLDVDIVLIPVGGTYTFDAKEATIACDTIKPKKFAIPMHYGTIVGNRNDADIFQKYCKFKVQRMD